MQIHALADASGKQQFRVGRPWQESASPHSDSPQDQSVSMQYNVQYLDGSKKRHRGVERRHGGYIEVYQ